MNRRRKSFVTPVLMILGLLISCGGGGGGGGGGGEGPTAAPIIPPAVQTTAALQGLWQGRWTSAQTLVSAAVLPDGRAWIVFSDASNTLRLIKAEFAIQGGIFSGTGKEYVPGTVGASSVTLSSTVIPGAQLQGSVTTGGLSSPFSMSYQPRYDVAAKLSDFSGVWSGSSANGTVTVSWEISSTNNVTGRSSTGCSYTGVLQTTTEVKSIVEGTFTEACAGANRAFAGVVTLDDSKAKLNVTATLLDDSAAILLSLEK